MLHHTSAPTNCISSLSLFLVNAPSFSRKIPAGLPLAVHRRRRLPYQPLSPPVLLLPSCHGTIVHCRDSARTLPWALPATPSAAFQTSSVLTPPPMRPSQMNLPPTKRLIRGPRIAG